MKILFDMQCLQSGSRYRGIGNASRNIITEFIRKFKTKYDIHLLINNEVPYTSTEIQRLFSKHLPSSNFHYWYALPGAGDHSDKKSPEGHVTLSKEILFRKIQDISPDYYIVMSVFEGGGIEPLITICPDQESGVRSGVIAYDLIPLIYPKDYLKEPNILKWYNAKIDEFKKFDHYFSISDCTKKDIMSFISIKEDKISNIYLDISKIFSTKRPIESKSNIVPKKPYIICTTNNDPRKNNDILFAAYAKLPKNIRQQYSLLVICHFEPNIFKGYLRKLRSLGIKENVIFRSGVSDTELVDLYTYAKLSIVPSLYEGFGLPILESMRTGCPIIASNTSSMMELIENPELTFDPTSADDMSRMMLKGLLDDAFREQLLQNGRIQSQKYSWEKTVETFEKGLAFALEKPFQRKPRPVRPPSEKNLHVVFTEGSHSGHKTQPHFEKVLSELSSKWNLTVVCDTSLPDLAHPQTDFAAALKNTRGGDPFFYFCSPQTATHGFLNLLLQRPGALFIDSLDFGSALERISFQKGYGSIFLQNIHNSHGYTALDNWLKGHPPRKPLHCALGFLNASLGVITTQPHLKAQFESDFGPSKRAPFLEISDLSRLASAVDTVLDSPLPPYVQLSHDTKAFFSEEIRALFLKAVSNSFEMSWRKKHLFVDVTMLYHLDMNTGIQRTIRGYAKQLMELVPDDWAVEFVRLTHDGIGNWHYLTARNFWLRENGYPHWTLRDNHVEFRKGDVFFGVDLVMVYPTAELRNHIISRIKASGAKVAFTIYDILPITSPEHFEPHIKEAHEKWLTTCATTADKLISISDAVKNDVARWIAKQEKPSLYEHLVLSSVHLGFDSVNIKHLATPDDHPHLKSHPDFFNAPVFLMVGTVESRKAHAQVYDAFLKLWEQGHNINLLFVGKRGWKIDELLEKLNTNKKNPRFLWLDNADDKLLQLAYKKSSCLIYASYNEGFGLPLIEAATQGIPLLVRDMPVFREVVGDSATYFKGREPEDIVRAVQQWLQLKAHQKLPDLSLVKPITWKESTQKLLAELGVPTRSE